MDIKVRFRLARITIAHTLEEFPRCISHNENVDFLNYSYNGSRFFCIEAIYIEIGWVAKVLGSNLHSILLYVLNPDDSKTNPLSIAKALTLYRCKSLRIEARYRSQLTKSKFHVQRAY